MGEKKLIKKEDMWTKSICEILRPELDENVYVDIFTKIPYAYEISHFDENWNVDNLDINEADYETDMVIYEKDGNKIIPRVIVESKIERISTHSAITYSQKAISHKNLIPFLRYGIMIGDRGDKALPGRLFRHGKNFDFLFSFSGEVPTDKEKDMFVSMIKKEIEYSREMEYILSNSKRHNKKRYFMLQKGFHLEEV